MRITYAKQSGQRDTAQQQKHRDTNTLHTHKSSQLPSARSWETEKQWTSVTPPEINTTIYREKEKMVCLCVCARKRIMDFEVDKFQRMEKREWRQGLM